MPIHSKNVSGIRISSVCSWFATEAKFCASSSVRKQYHLGPAGPPPHADRTRATRRRSGPKALIQYHHHNGDALCSLLWRCGSDALRTPTHESSLSGGGRKRDVPALLLVVVRGNRACPFQHACPKVEARGTSSHPQKKQVPSLQLRPPSGASRLCP
jgi:hypothetical protein